jgi:hypothetical protein
MNASEILFEQGPAPMTRTAHAKRSLCQSRSNEHDALQGAQSVSGETMLRRRQPFDEEPPDRCEQRDCAADLPMAPSGIAAIALVPGGLSA